MNNERDSDKHASRAETAADETTREDDEQHSSPPLRGQNADDIDDNHDSPFNPLVQESVPIYKGHLTPWWVLGTAYLLLFIVYLGLREFGHAKAGFILHTLVALVFVLACSWNLFHTPSHGERWYRPLHRWMGWTAMCSGLFVVVSGYVLVIRGDTSLSEAGQATFMATGAFQIVVQALMVYLIRKEAVFQHVIWSNVLFFSCAFLPAANRAPQIFGFEDWGIAWTLVVIPLGVILTALSIRHYAKVMDQGRAS